MRERTGSQAFWWESGGRGADTLAPLPWVTLLLSFCALVSLWPSSPSRLLTLPTQVVTPPTRSLFLIPPPAPLAGLKAFISTQKQLTLPWVRGMWREGLIRNRKGSLLSCCCTPPVQALPSLDAHQSASEASVTKKSKTTLVNSHGSF